MSAREVHPFVMHPGKYHFPADKDFSVKVEKAAETVHPSQAGPALEIEKEVTEPKSETEEKTEDPFDIFAAPKDK